MNGQKSNTNRALVLLALSVAFPTTVGAAGQSKFVKTDRPDGATEPPAAFVSDEFIVVLSRKARVNAAVRKDARGKPTINVPSLQQVVATQGVRRLRRQFPTAKAHPVGSRFPDLTGHYKVELNGGVDLDTAMVEFARDPHVEHVEKIGIHALHAVPNDPFFFNNPPVAGFPYNQWSLWENPCGMGAIDAWDREAGDNSVVVAVLDSGVRYVHADLGGSDPPGPADAVTNGNIWINPAEIPGNGVDDDLNGYVDDVVGYDFVESTVGAPNPCCDDDCSGVDNDPSDHFGHGTHVAGTVGAITNNGLDVSGVAGGFSAGNPSDPAGGAKIMVLRIGWSASDFLFGCIQGIIRTDYAAEAMQYVADQVDAGVNVTAVNCSWSSSDTGGLGAAVDALLARDVMVIHAAGNSASTTADFLGTKAGVLNVAATDQLCDGAFFTNYGSWVDVAAPGVNIVSTYHYNLDPANDYISVLDGTSMAAPHVCGVAALLESCTPALTGPDKFNLIVSTAAPYNNDGRNLGSGIVNANNALIAAGCTAGPECTTDAECGDGDACNGTETCNAGACQPGTPVNCNDVVSCTVDSCDGLTGQCAHTPDDTACDDGLFCNGAETCNPAVGCESSGNPCAGTVCDECSDACLDNCPGDPAKIEPGLCGCGTPDTDTDGDGTPDCLDACPNDSTKTVPGNCGCGVPETDCVPTGGCGDGICDACEDQCTCAADCGAPPTDEVDCTNGVDDDCDGFTDCNDPDNCQLDPACNCSVVGDPCVNDGECCSNKCKGPAGRKTCK